MAHGSVAEGWQRLPDRAAEPEERAEGEGGRIDEHPHNAATRLLCQGELDIDVSATAARRCGLELDVPHGGADLDDDVIAECVVLGPKNLERLSEVEQEMPGQLSKEYVFDHLLAQHRVLRGPQIEHGATLPR